MRDWQTEWLLFNDEYFIYTGYVLKKQTCKKLEVLSDAVLLVSIEDTYILVVT